MNIAVRSIKKSAAAMAAVAAVAAGAFAAETAYVPFVVNIDATVTAEYGPTLVTLNMAAGEVDTLKLPLGNVSVFNQSGRQSRQNAPVITGSRGNITLRLPWQSYQNAEIALYSVNGKRILRSKVSAPEASSAISRRNIASGVYMLSVKGANGEMFTSRLTHSGGKMNIGVAFGVENVSPAAADRQFAKAAAVDDWDIAVLVDDDAAAAGYNDYRYALNPVAGSNPKQVINLSTGGNVNYGGHVTYGGEVYQTVVIGEQTWFARNLNYDVPGVTTGVCYGNRADNCEKYGRLYNWSTAMGGAPSSNLNPSGVQGVCPAGWHLPSWAEWTQLHYFVRDFVGDVSTASGTKLKSSTGWRESSGVPAGTDDFGFSALPGGYGTSNASFWDVGEKGRWLSATDSTSSNAKVRVLSYNREGTQFGSYSKDNFSASVRCVRDW